MWDPLVTGWKVKKKKLFIFKRKSPHFTHWFTHLTYARIDSVTVPIWLTFSSRQLQAFSSTALLMRLGLVTVRSSPTTWMSVLPVKSVQAVQSSWSKGSSMETTGSKEHADIPQWIVKPRSRSFESLWQPALLLKKIDKQPLELWFKNQDLNKESEWQKWGGISFTEQTVKKGFCSYLLIINMDTIVWSFSWKR